LRGYRDLCTIAQSRNGMEGILKAAPELFKLQTRDLFASKVLEQLSRMLGAVSGNSSAGLSACVIGLTAQTRKILAGTGRFSGLALPDWDKLPAILGSEGRDLIESAIERKRFQQGNRQLAIYVATGVDTAWLVYVAGNDELGEIDRTIISLFCTNLSAAIINLELFRELENRIDEKSVLIREIHHRVKNNLQIILSLIDLSDPESSSPALSGVRRRIGAMAVIHDRVSNLNNEKDIDFVDCAPDIAADVAHGFSLAGNTPTILSESNGFVLPLEQAVPCSLLIEEILTFAITSRQADSPIVLILNGRGAAHQIQVWYQHDSSAGNCADTDLRLASRLAEQLGSPRLRIDCDVRGKSCITCDF